MNKLISKNPIQRFKQGRKIVKAQWGLRTREDGVIVNSAGVPVGKSIMGSSYEYEKSFPEDKLILPGLYQDKDTKAVYSPNNMDSNGNYNQVLSGPSPIQNGTYYETKDTSGKVTDRGRYFGGKKHSLPIRTDGNKTSTPKKHKSNSVQQRNPGAYHNITTWQNKLKDFYEPGTFAADGIWGKNTEAAYQKYLQLATIPELSQEEAKEIKAQKMPMTPSIYSLMNPVEKNLKTPLSVPQTYNRTQVREFLKNKGVNPYSFSGNQRKALRMVLNGQGTDEDKALIQSMRIFKKGGQLPSRNIVERFKNKINKN